MDSVKAPEKKKGKYDPFEDYEIESAANDIQRAEEHKADPEKMKHIKAHMDTKKKAMDKAHASINSTDDLRKLYKEKTKSKG